MFFGTSDFGKKKSIQFLQKFSMRLPYHPLLLSFRGVRRRVIPPIIGKDEWESDRNSKVVSSENGSRKSEPKEKPRKFESDPPQEQERTPEFHSKKRVKPAEWLSDATTYADKATTSLDPVTRLPYSEQVRLRNKS